MAPVARELSRQYGILEPFLAELTIGDQLRELEDILNGHATLPVTIIGYSWGAVLGFLFTGKNPGMVKKLIMVSSAPFEAGYAVDILETRIGRLSHEDATTLKSLVKEFTRPGITDMDELFGSFGEMMLKADSYDPVPRESERTGFRYEVFTHISDEFEELRKTGALAGSGRDIMCPVIAVHGDYDPHPADGVRIPLSCTIRDFKFILLESCGHTPWIERRAAHRFFEVLRSELQE
jgi:pimeloyl-ACP methyl ester carboxylesterase